MHRPPMVKCYKSPGGLTMELKHVQQQIEALDADLSGSTFNDVKLAGAAFVKVNLSGSTFNNVRLEGATIVDVNLSNATFDDVNLAGAQIHNANLSGWRVQDVNLARLQVTNADLRGATFTDCLTEGMAIDGIQVADLLAAYRSVQTGK